jgi:hypothetical protein
MRKPNFCIVPLTVMTSVADWSIDLVKIFSERVGLLELKIAIVIEF